MQGSVAWPSTIRAYVALAWLLVPGASLVAGRLRRLTDAIDEVVVGQLWIQICDHDPADDTYVATTILRRVERESMAELGLGELAKRRDPTCANSVLIERYDETIPAEEPTLNSHRSSSSSSCGGRSTQERCPTRIAACSWIWLSRPTLRMRLSGRGGLG